MTTRETKRKTELVRTAGKKKGRPNGRPFFVSYGVVDIPPATSNFPCMSRQFFQSGALKLGRAVAFGVLLVFSFARSASAQDGGVTHVDTVSAPSLHNNLLGDPDRRPVTVYLPPSYAKEKHRRYPVVYLLHGFAADHRAFMKGAYQNLNVRISMDSLIHAGAVKEMIVVTPSARDAFDGSFYINSPVTGNWEDFIVKDLVSYIDRHYRTIPKRSARGITGHSMGGFGALRVGMRHPETFSAIYMLSACCLATGEDMRAIIDKPWKAAVGVTDMSQVAKAGFNADIDLALTAAYSPNTSKSPLYLDFPYRLEGDSLVVDDAVASRWRETPIAMVPKYAASLKRMAIAFDAGRQDAFKDIPRNVTRLDSMLTSLGVPHSAELYDGTHGSRFRARLETKALPFFSNNLH